MKLINVLITGANRGLGLQFVKEFTRTTPPTQHVIATCRQKSSALELLKLAAENSNIHIFELDVRDDSQYPRLIDDVKSLVGDSGISLLVNNAGVNDKTVSDVEKVTKENLMAHFETNVVAPVLFTKAMLPLLQQAVITAKRNGEKEASAGVVNISSVMGCSHYVGTMPISMPYRVSKAALNKATHCLSFELASEDIVVTAVHPGWVRTDMGTMNAPIGPEESVQNIMSNIILKLGQQHSGKLYNFSGSELAF